MNIYGTVSCWLWMNRAYVGIGACLNLNVPWHNHNCIIGYYSNTLQRRWHTAHDSAVILMHVGWIYYITVSCWLWMNREYVGIGAYLLSLLRVSCTMTRSQLHNRLLFKYTTMAMAHGTKICADWFWYWLNIWNGAVLALDEQSVRWYRCMFESECAIPWCTMHHDMIAIGPSSAIQMHYNGYDGTWHTTLRWFRCWLNIWNGVVLALDEQRVRWYRCMFEFECLVYDAP